MIQDSPSVLNITRQKLAYIGSLYENVKELHMYKLFGLKATTYLRHNCSVHMPQLQSHGRHKRYVTLNHLLMISVKL